MNANTTQMDLPANIAQKLKSIRQREAGLTWLSGFSLTLAVLLGAMLAAMAADWAFGWFDPRVRFAFTAVALLGAGMAFVFWCLRPLARRRSLVSTAREVDRSMPELEERWSTVTELSQNHDAPEMRGSKAMLSQVASEAESASNNISPQAVISMRPAIRASRWPVAAAVVVAAWLAVDFTDAKLLMQRFWLPGADISLTQVTATQGTAFAARGEALSLEATIKGRLPKTPAAIRVRNAQGVEKEIPMSTAPDTEGSYHYSIEEVTESFDYRVRAGDGQTPWHRITAIERPVISAVKLTVKPPAYSQLPAEQKEALPSMLRVLESSEVEVSFKADQALDQLTLDLGDGKSAQLSAGPDQWYHYRTQATESFSLTASAVNTSKFANKHKPTCRISVYEDQAPTLKLSAPDELDILPGEKVKVAFEASDDFGIAKAEIEVTTTKADGETSTQNIPIALDGEAGKKKVQKSIDLDPKAMGLKHGDQLSYVVRVTDTKAKKTEGSDADAKPPGQSSPKDGELAKNNAPSKNDAEAAEQLPGEPKDDAGQKSEAESGGEKPEEEKTANEKSGIPSALAKAGEPKSSKPKEDQGSKPPGNEMALRALDCGQSCECSPKNIKVDEWAGSFEGDKRRKLEIAIDPVLKLLDSLLVKAGEQTDPLKSPAATEEGLQETHTGPLEAAKGFLKESITVTADLKSRTNGTPYAFAGLQVHNIGQAHVLPAQTNLAAVAISAPAPNENGAQVDQASLHILRAREMLAALTRSYETVKREQKVADAMQKIQKMYQIFIEDTQALLVSKKGAINSYDRKIAEVDDDYVEKLKALMEEKKKIMDELAKVLGEDPRMLRRYLAMQNLQATSYRDQMTLLAERQKEVTSQVSEWNASPEKERAALSKKLEQTFAPRQRQVVEEAVKMHENMETWLPLDIKPDHDKVQELLQRAGKVVQFASESTGEKRQHASANVLEELYLLRTSLPGVAQIESKDQAKLTAYVANRLEEVESLITTQSGQMRTMESLAKGDFAKAAEIVQQRIAVETTTLGEKIDTTKKQVSPMSAEIATKAEALDKVVQGDILPPQKASIEHLAGTNIKAAGEKLDAIVPAFALAENTFDELMRLIIAKLDEAPAGGSPGSAPDMESILAMLQNEMKAKDSLGIPCRPTNVMMMTDWMKPGEGKGQGQGREMAQAQAKAAQAQAKKDQSESEKLGKEARDRAKKAMAEADKLASATAVVPPPPNDTKRRSDAWNKLASRLEKDLLQGRDNTPPEQYRAAIESYFQAISGSTSEVSK